MDATMAEDDVPEQWEIFKEINRVYFEEGHEAGEKMVADYLASKARRAGPPRRRRRRGRAPALTGRARATRPAR